MSYPFEVQWTVGPKRQVYAGRVRLFEHDVVLPDGSDSHYEVDESIPFAAAVLLADDRGLHLARQYRYPLREWIFDLPGGAGEIGETPEATARRECREEFGVMISDLTPLGEFASNPGRTAWRTHLFLGRGLHWTGIDRATPDETVHAVTVSVAEALLMLRDGEFIDPGLSIALARAHARSLLERV